MGERIWTDAQSEAFSALYGDLLVCAAAGSGKTAVLTERIIRSLCDDSRPSDITSKLVVTFTKSAANELKAKISSALTERIGGLQGNARLRRQLLSLDRAQISTIDSFCLNVVSAHFAELGLPASVRVGGDADIKLMKIDIMEQTIDAAYSTGDKAFLDLIDNFSTLRDNRVGELFLKIYDKVMSFPEGVEFIKESAMRLDDAAKNGFSGSEYESILANKLNDFLAHYVSVYEHLLEKLKDDGTPEKSVILVLDELEKIKRIHNAGDLDEKKNMLENFSFEKAPQNKSKTETFLYFASVRENFKKDRQNQIDSLHRNISSEKIAAEMSARLCMALYRLVSDFERRYTEEKRRFSMIDFADAERMTYDLLIKNGQPTERALSISEKFDQIYIDEYQDVNDIQDGIFKAISNNNRFMVGDIKQSIYGFRGAVPTIFADYRRSFPKHERDVLMPQSKVFLSHNFRSDRHILDFANNVCNRLFACSEQIPYSPDEDELRFPETKVDDSAGKRVNIFLVCPEDDLPSDQCEAAFVADKIADLISGGKSPSDIAILLRSFKSREKFFRKELKKRGIPFESPASDDFLKMPEILLIISILNAIDNPRRDYSLAGAMKSPIFGITLDDLILLRDHNKDCTLYESLCLAVDEGRFEKGKAFLDFLVDCRDYAKANSTEKIIKYVYDKTALLSIFSGKKGGKDAVSRLNSFYEFARSFESGSFRGLHNFIRYLDDIDSEVGNPLSDVSTVSGQGVKLMSVHKSKGLEFPIVFLSHANGKLNTSDSKNSFLLDRDLGISFNLSVKNGRGKFIPMTKFAISQKIMDDNINEEMRVLYVALTRPKNELYITATPSKTDEYMAECFADGETLDFYTLYKNQSYLEWIFAAIGRDPSSCEISTTKYGREMFDNPHTATFTALADGDFGELDLSDIRKKIEYVYPHKVESELPTKASISKLYPTYLDEADVPDVRYRFDSQPDFMRTSNVAKGTDIGIATHLFMQFCDFEFVCQNGVEAELARLVDKGFIDKTSAELVRLDLVKAFFRSSLFEQMRQASEIYREYRFLTDFPASDFSNDPERAEALKGKTILVQGVIDCFFIMPDGRVKLVDYKTDKLDKRIGVDKAVERLVNEYKNQLTYYAKAIKKMSGRDVSSASVFAFDIGREIDIEI